MPKKKYKTEEERKEANRISQRNYRARNNNKEYKKKMSQIIGEWKKKNKDKVNQYKRSKKAKETRKIWRKKRLKEDINFKISENLRSKLSTILKSQKIPKKSKALELLGVKIKYFKKYLEYRFLPGMTWDNHGKVWHLDHIIPISAIDFSKDENLKFAFHYRNFQPLLAKDNLIKSNNIFIPIESHIKLRDVDVILKNITKRLKPDLEIDPEIFKNGILLKVLSDKK